jgi:hypothetical protein
MTNRITPYAGGWLTFLVSQGICTESEAREAQGRVAQATIDELERRREAKREAKREARRKRRKRENREEE